MISLEYVIQHVVESLHSAVRVFDLDGTLVRYYGNTEKIDAVLHDRIFFEALFAASREEYPVIYEDVYPVYFMVIRHQRQIYIIGGINCDYTVESIEGIKLGVYFSRKHQTPVENYRISYQEMHHFCSECLLLFNILKSQEMTYQTLLEKNSNIQQIQKEIKQELNRIYFRFQEQGKLHNSYEREVREMNYVREGDLDSIHVVTADFYEGDFGTLSRNPLRAVKNLAIAAVTLCTRAAIEGGLDPEEAFSLSDSLILQIEAAETIQQTEYYMYFVKVEFTRRVRDTKLNKGSNQLVDDAKSLIYKKMHGRVVIREIARELGITPEYLSTLFKKSEGVTINDYIMRKKIAQSENMLIYSEESIGDIGYYLGFCSQSHFGRTFKQVNGMTPSRFRKKYKTREFRTRVLAEEEL